VKYSSVLLVFMLSVFLLSPAALAHVPLLAEGNENISSAMYISDPGKSWAVYGFLSPGTAQYYSFDLESGQRIYLSLLKSTNPEEKDFQPEMALLGPGVKTQVQPRQVQPAGHVFVPQSLKSLGYLEVEGKNKSEPFFEPFGPGSYISVAELDMAAPQSGRYYVAVYDNETSGRYSLAVGYREEFSYLERITTPIRLIWVYVWEGQSAVMVLFPYLAAEFIGLLVFWRGPKRTAYCLAGTLAGFLFLATSASIITQIIINLTRVPFGPEVYISLTIAVFHAILGVVTLRLARGEAGILQRVLLAVIGTIALLAGSGLILGPLLAIAASMLPSQKSIFSEPVTESSAAKS
jgi:hypothetical protein